MKYGDIVKDLEEMEVACYKVEAAALKLPKHVAEKMHQAVTWVRRAIELANKHAPTDEVRADNYHAMQQCKKLLSTLADTLPAGGNYAN